MKGLNRGLLLLLIACLDGMGWNRPANYIPSCRQAGARMGTYGIWQGTGRGGVGWDGIGWDGAGWDIIVPTGYIPACRQAGARTGASVGAQAEEVDIGYRHTLPIELISWSACYYLYILLCCCV